MEFDLPTTAAAFIAVVALGVAALFAMDVMATDTILMMVTPSMILFGFVCLLIGVKYGEQR